MGDQGQSKVSGVGFDKVKPYLAMVSLQFGYAGMNIVTVLCLKRGLSHYVLVVYRHAIALVAVAPFALVFERKQRPKMTISTFLKIMVLGLLEPVLDQNLYCVGMRYTSATFASAIMNALPAITFIMAIIFRLEKVKIKKLHSQAKVLGTIVTVVGAMLMTLYKGPIIEMVWTRGRGHHETSTAVSDQHWFAGTLFIIGSCFAWSGFFIVQSFALKNYPAELSLTSWVCFTGMIEGAAVALVMERDLSAWTLGLDARLLAPVYSGVFCSAIAFYVQGLVIKERGPVFVTAFNPLCMIIVAALGSFILAEQIHLGSVIGAIIIVIGLYSVVWGKSKDHLISSSPLMSTNEKDGSLELPIAIISYGTKTNVTSIGIEGDSKSNAGTTVPTSK